MILQLPSGQVARQRVEAGGWIGDDSLPDVLRRDSYGPAAMAAIMGQRSHDVIRNHRKGGRQGRGDVHQALRIEAGKQALGYRRVYVARPEILLLESGGGKPVELRRVARRERLRLVGKAGEGGSPKIVSIVSITAL